MFITEQKEIEQTDTLSQNQTEPVQEQPDITNVEEEPKVMEHQKLLNTLLTEVKPINFQERANLSDGEKLTKNHYLIISVEEILSLAQKNDWGMCMNNGEIYVYNSCYWSPLPKPQLEDFLGKAAERLGVDWSEARFHTFRKDLVKQFFSTGFIQRPVKYGDEVLINLKNGTFLITPERQVLLPFDRNDFMTYQLPFCYYGASQCPLFHKYLDRVLPDKELQKILAEYIGYVFIKKNTLKLEKAMILYGSGANGKSVFFEVVFALLGKDNVSNFSLQSLTNATGYQRAKLDDKLLNYASEISANMESTIFKQLISGEPIEARLPYKEPFILSDYAKFIFNTNGLPKDVEQNEAFFRRFLIIPFLETIPEEERDSELPNKIITTELPGVFNWVLEGLRRLVHNKNFTPSDVVANAVKEYREQSDTVILFLMEEGYEPDIVNEVPLKVMYDQYKVFCKESGYVAVSLRVYAERLRAKHFTTTRKRNGTVVYAKK